MRGLDILIILDLSGIIVYSRLSGGGFWKLSELEGRRRDQPKVYILRPNEYTYSINKLRKLKSKKILIV